MKQAATILDKTYKLPERGWCQGHEAENEYGRVVDYRSPDASCFCLTAAFFLAAKGKKE